MSAANEDTPTVRLGPVMPKKNIFFEPDPGSTCLIGRAFAVTGEYDASMLHLVVGRLKSTSFFYTVTQLGVIVRMKPVANHTWSSPLALEEGQVPSGLAAVRESIGEQGEVSLLSYAIASICGGLGWDPANVRIEESPIG